MEIDIQSAEGGRVAGRVKVTYSGRTNCSTDWVKLLGTQDGRQVVVNYDLGGSCGKVSATFPVGAESTTSGTWSNQYGSGGPLSLTKQ